MQAVVGFLAMEDQAERTTRANHLLGRFQARGFV